MALVDPEISRRKLGRELAAWEKQAASYRQRGYVIVGSGDLTVDVAFLARLPIGDKPEGLPAVTACARLDFTNYDMWPPSVIFVDALTGQALAQGPPVGALDFRPGGSPSDPGGPQTLLLAPHPVTQRPFICQAGIREYHTHPEHSGDDWLLHRGSGQGTLAAICEQLWLLMARTVCGVQFMAQQLPGGGRGLSIQIVQTDFEALEQQAAALRAQAIAQRLQASGAPLHIAVPEQP